ncbi:hypothetical protein [Streptomyces iconiensis]|uniref:Uncharacterized protein n=1 Tax=Streptomyces iconiensis TaxID=1384038 RepID=A0ABT7A2T5_9ACTN|nr:hypothetical protein [Streptomyces iconiensis]MDJ1135662.1 hypothetical protein [Streptomyces iconiensis]
MDDRRTAEGLDNALLAAVREGRASTDNLRRLVAAEAQCHQAEMTAYGVMLTRFPGRPAATLYVTLSQLVNGARPKLTACAEELGMDPDNLWLRPRDRRTFAFAGALSWIALNGSQAATALALHTDMAVYFPQCEQLVRDIGSSKIEAPDSFLDYYASGGSQELLDLAADVVADGLSQGDDPEAAAFMADLLWRSIDDLWRAAAGDAEDEGASAGGGDEGVSAGTGGGAEPSAGAANGPAGPDG